MGGGSGDPNLFLQISFSWVKMSFHVEFHPSGLPRTGQKVCGVGWVGGGGCLNVNLVFYFGPNLFLQT